MYWIYLEHFFLRKCSPPPKKIMDAGGEEREYFLTEEELMDDHPYGVENIACGGRMITTVCGKDKDGNLIASVFCQNVVVLSEVRELSEDGIALVLFECLIEIVVSL